jgi:predicted dinucleotide-binding enzyme
MANARRELGETVFFAPTVAECIARSEVVVVATPWREFLEIPAAVWASGASGRVVVDCWRGLKHIENVSGIRYLSLGIGALES